MSRTTSSIVIAVATVYSGTALAQDAASPPSPASNRGLEEIVVTAQKRSENLQRVPIAITAASGEKLAASGVTDTMHLNTVVPGLNVRVDAGSFQPSIRGIGTASTVTENPVALYIDGVYIPQQREGLREFEDIEQIAVLKGPQGTLFGRNATAGVIQITTKRPSFDFSGKMHAEVDNYATVKGGAYLTGGLSDNVAASLAIAYGTQGDGWGKNRTTGKDTFRIDHDFSIRGKLFFQLGENTDATIAGDYADWKRFANSRQPLPGTRLSFDNPYVTSPLKSVYDTYAGTDSYIALHGGGVSLAINHGGEAVKLVSITAYRDLVAANVFDNTAVPNTPNAPALQVVRQPRLPSRSFSQEFQVISNGGGRLDWMFGVYYFNYDNITDPIQRNFGGLFTPSPTSIAQTLSYATENSESVAPFGQMNWEFLPDTHLTLGARYTYERRELKDARVISTNKLGVTTTTNFAKNVRFSEPTIRIALDHKFSADMMAYASFSTGFKSGGFNTVSPQTAGYLPEKLKAYAAGFKSELLDRRLRLNVEGFYYDYTNLQVIQFINTTQQVVNGPKAKLYGVDVDFEAQITDGLRASGGFELVHTEFTDFNGAVFAYPNPGGLGNTLAPGDATGNRLPLAQSFSGTLAVDYHHVLPAGSLDFNVTANYNGDYYFQADNLVRQSPYTLFNASVTWNLPGDAISLKIWGKNLANEKVITSVVEQNIGFPTVFANPPLTFGGSIAINF
ncbi:hypothetical protein C1T17_02805 [Sphingobium sp. SCG-1]|uniref:TonB-dependent receptor n=1 Tax=Sphingobium sp. SCG-1 TaxID=2072936 RepID=UPI000CD6C3D0|nr:TonB-dependent receptor [Sphingobium sp. SCG-1]AUW57176.1 hypothetical protein C1T17_02805 [Sphingobium sp. SCG-1]